MNKRFSRIFSSSSTDPTTHGKRNLWLWLVEPVATITDASERRQARLVSAILLVVILTMSVGSVVEAFILHDLTIAYILVGSVLSLGIAYTLSRTRHYRLAIPVQFIVYISWPILGIGLSKNYSLDYLLTIFMFNVFTILLSGTLVSFSTTVFLATGNVLSILLLPIFIPAIPYVNMVLPLSFNLVAAALILVLTQHRNLMEKERLLVVSQANEQLQVELTERKRVEEQLVHSALHDSLTDLPNRVLFMDRLQHAIERAKRHKNYKYAVLFLDLDRFKVVNDSLGHNIGDQLLIETASRLTACLRSVDTVARLGAMSSSSCLKILKAPWMSLALRIASNMIWPYPMIWKVTRYMSL